MASTEFPLGSPMAAKLWSKKTFYEALAQTHMNQFVGSDSSALVQVLDETEKNAGDTVYVPLLVDLQGDGVSEGDALEGMEESLSYYRDGVVINELSHAVRIKERIDPQRVPMRLREDTRRMLQQWYANRMDEIFFNQLAGNTAQTSAVRYGFNTPTAPTTTSGDPRILYADGLSTSEASLSASQTFQLSMLDTAVNLAKRTSPLIRPVKVGAQEYYVCFIHPDQARSLRQNTNTGSWLDLQKAAMTGGEIEKNPIFTGALGIYNNVVLHENRRVPLAPGLANVRRAIFCGAQSAIMAYGKGYGKGGDWVEDQFDYEREYGVSYQTIFGLKKTVYNSKDFATIAIPTYSSAPA